MEIVNTIVLENGGYYDTDVEIEDITIDKLPDNMSFCRNLTISNVIITNGMLPKELRVAGDLRLIGLNLEALPTDLQVYGNIYITNCNIKYLPDPFLVNKSLEIENSKINKINNIVVGGNLTLDSLQNIIKNDFNINLTILGDCNLYYYGDSWNKITGNIIVKGFLYIRGCNIIGDNIYHLSNITAFQGFLNDITDYDYDDYDVFYDDSYDD